MMKNENHPEWEYLLLKEALSATTESCEGLLREFDELKRKIDKDYSIDRLNVSELLNRMGSLKIANRVVINLVLRIVAQDFERNIQLVNQD